jgi:hypothetical protein
VLSVSIAENTHKNYKEEIKYGKQQEKQQQE